MNTESGVFVRIGGQVVALTVNRPVVVNEDEEMPSESLAPVRCDSCGAMSVIAGPVTYQIYDDEYTSHFDLWYESHHRGDCVTCGAALEVVLHYLRTGKSYRELREISLASNMSSKGAKLASTEGVEIPEEALRVSMTDLDKGDSGSDIV
jgi:hypothetical protein